MSEFPDKPVRSLFKLRLPFLFAKIHYPSVKNKSLSYIVQITIPKRIPMFSIPSYCFQKPNLFFRVTNNFPNI